MMIRQTRIDWRAARTSCACREHHASRIPLPTGEAPGLHADRALGGDLDHPDRQRRRLADRAAGLEPSPGQRGGADPSGGLGRCSRLGHQEQRAQRDPPAPRPGVPDRVSQRPINGSANNDRPVQPLASTASFRSRRRRIIPRAWSSIYPSNRLPTTTLSIAYAWTARDTYPMPCARGERRRSSFNRYLPNRPTSWFWNIRVGDKIQINNAGPWYTVVGPMVIIHRPIDAANTELFVNVGPPGTTITFVQPARRASTPSSCSW